MTRCDDVMQCNMAWRHNGTKQRGNASSKIQHGNTATKQPTKQVDMERGKDTTMRGEEDATRGEQRWQIIFFWIHIVFLGGRLCRITFNIGIDSARTHLSTTYPDSKK